MTLVTAYGFPHHGNRSFTFVQADALPVFLITVADPLHSLWMTPFVLRHHDVFRSPSLVTCFPKIVIQNGGKNAVWERWETGQWHEVKNLLL
jgi:hypothetical protein